jgi:putative NADH-flavin reductase
MYRVRITTRVLAIAMVCGVALAAQLAQAEKIVVYGASGAIGGVIVNEALNRGHTVIGVSREPAKLDFHNKKFTAVAGDVTDLASFRSVTKGVDAVIISVSGSGKDNLPENSVIAQAAKIATQAFTGVRRNPYVIQIGGATTIYETKEAMLAHLPFPAEPGSAAYGMLFGHLVALQTYRASNIRWTVLTPPAEIDGWSMGAKPVLNRTGKYRTSTAGLVEDASGKSVVNVADLAVAAVDEAEKQRFVGKRFTIGY